MKHQVDNAVCMGSVPLFTPTVPPRITSISHDFLAKWKVKRREYEAELRARCRVSGEDFDAVLTPIIETFDAELLDTFYDLRLRTPTADVTEGMLIAEIDHIAGSVMNDTLPDIKALFKSKLRLNMTEDDVEARVLDYFNCFGQVTRSNGLSECFEGEAGRRERCKRLVASLHPATLKAEVKLCIRYSHKLAATDPRLLYELIVEKATEHEQQFRRLKSEKRGKFEKRDRSGRDEPQPDKDRLRKDKRKSRGSKSRNPLAVETTRTATETKPPTKAAKLPPSPCPKCKEMHWIRDCPKATTEAEKDELRKTLRERAKAKRSRLKRLGELLPICGREVTVNGVLRLPYCPDSGSDYTVIGHSHWELLKTKDPSVEAERLVNPVRNQAYGSTWVTADKKVRLYLLIHTAAGPVEPMSAVDVLIADVDDDEFIVGNDLLLSLGIDVDRQLEMLSDRGNDETSGDNIKLEADEPPVAATSSSDEDIFAAVERLLNRALENGFPVDRLETLRTIVHAYDVWRLELRDDPPANVPPMEVRLRDGARPVKCKPRKYPPHIRHFLREFNSRLVTLGLVYENPDSRWASPVLPVKKSADLMDLRQTTDYRAVNELTDVRAAVMPILSLAVEHARGMNHFGLFDFLKGFWQLPLAELCQEFLSYMTDEKNFTPRRVPQGSSDAAIFFQQTMEKCFATLLYDHLLIWIDDLLLYANDIDVYLDKLAELFSLLNQFGLKLSAKKSSLYQTQVKWCGKVIDGQGIRHDAERIHSLRSLPYPLTAGELQQFVCAINWMRESIIGFARQVDPLQRRLDAALASTKRTRRAAASIEIELTDDERRAFDDVKEALATAATLDFPDDSVTTCLFTDASDVGYAVIVTQVADFDPKKPATEQQHRLIHCTSGTFTGSQCNWTVIEKEAYPIVVACDKLDYLLLRPKPFRMYCDHRNLIHVFAPHESVKKHVRGKLLRWAMKLMNYRYVVEHVPGPDNVWADMISRWAGNHNPTVTRLKTVRASPQTATESVSTLRPLDDEHFVWPTLQELREVQAMNSPPAGAVRTENGLLTLHDRLWIPPDAKELLQRLCIVAHCGAQGHRGQHAMVAHLQRLFAIDHVAAVVAKFVKDCLLCLHSKGGKIIPRPWSETIDCSTRNGVLHFDYLYMGESYGDSKYLLVLKDHATHYCELVVADTPDSTVVVEALLAWHSRFGIPPDWISDNGTHFKNEVVAELSRRLRTRQTFTPAYSPWVNGSIERVNRDILQVVRTMILTYKISYKDWVYLVPMIQANLNHTPVPSLGNKAPVELFTGLQCPTPLREFYLPDKGGLQEVPASEQIDEYLDELRSSLHAMHCKVEDRRLQQRLLNKKRERGENLVNFAVGDYVLRSRVDAKHRNKLQVTWVGPYRVVRADAHSFRVQHLVTGDELDVHASRLKMYADSSLDVTDELLEHVASQGIILTVDKLNEHRWNDNIKDYEICVSWKGLQQIEDSYEPVKSLAKEIRVLVDNYATKANDSKFTEYWNKLQGVVMEPTLSLPPTRSQPPADQQPRASQDAVHQPQRRMTSRKRRRRQPARGAATSDLSTTASARVLPSAQVRQPRRAQDEDGQKHINAEGHDSQPPLGSRTRSTTSAAPTSATGAPSLEPASKRARRQRRSRSTTLVAPTSTAGSTTSASTSGRAHQLRRSTRSRKPRKNRT